MFPIVQLITLKDTPEREAHALKQLNNVGLSYNTHRFNKMSPGWKGCINSHLQVYQYGQNINLETIFVCEDNILANLVPFHRYQNLFKFIKECPDWGIIWLGGYILRPWDDCSSTEYPQVYETRNNNHGTVSYLIHQRLYQQILRMNLLSPIDQHYDIFISQFKCYIYNPFLFYHANNIKSNINQNSDRWRKYWFHPSIMPIHSYIFFNRRKVYIFCMIIILVYWLLGIKR